MEELEIDTQDMEIPMTKVEEKPTTKRKVSKKVEHIIKESNEDYDGPVSCLRNERVIVRFVPRERGNVTNPKHILYGGLAENAIRWFTLPRLQSGMYVNALTDNEKAYLEEVMGLEFNALSIYRKENNYWDNLYVRLTKQDNYLDLSNPDDYIKYKVLLANKDYIAPSMEVLQDKPKATYQFVILKEGDELKNAKKSMNTTMQAYMRFGEIQNEADLLKLIIETINSRPLARNSKLEFLQDSVNKIIQSDAKLFLKVASDPLLGTKALIRKCVEEGLISNRGGMLYLRSDGTPLCGDNEEPTLNIAAKFLNQPKNQEIKFALEAKLSKE